MQETMTGRVEQETIAGTMDYACDYERSFCFNRSALDDGGGSLNRDRNKVSAQDLVTLGYVNNVVNDIWIGLIDQPQTANIAVLSDAQYEFHDGRMLGKFAQ